MGYDGSTKQWNAIIKRAQSIADKTNAVQAVAAVGDTETGVPTHAVIISSPGFVGSTFESQNSKAMVLGKHTESLYPGLPTSIVVPKKAVMSVASLQADSDKNLARQIKAASDSLRNQSGDTDTDVLTKMWIHRSLSRQPTSLLTPRTLESSL